LPHRGQAAEGLALAYLQKKGWKILTRNFRTRAAELDLVALDGKTVGRNFDPM